MFTILFLIAVAVIAFAAYKQRANVKAAIDAIDEHADPAPSVTVPAAAPVAEAAPAAVEEPKAA